MLYSNNKYEFDIYEPIWLDAKTNPSTSADRYKYHKPIRLNSLWNGFCSWRIDGRFIEFRILGVYQEFFRHLEWEDEPVEVYLNLD